MAFPSLFTATLTVKMSPTTTVPDEGMRERVAALATDAKDRVETTVRNRARFRKSLLGMKMIIH
jgi:hypothetical protein